MLYLLTFLVFTIATAQKGDAQSLPAPSELKDYLGRADNVAQFLLVGCESVGFEYKCDNSDACCSKCCKYGWCASEDVC